jgi:hypothetical protein
MGLFIEIAAQLQLDTIAAAQMGTVYPINI